jgi:hypothetical protein
MIPIHKDDLTIEQFMRCSEITKQFSDLECEIELISYLTGKSVDEIESYEFGKSEKLFSRIRKLIASKPTETVKDLIWIGGIPHKALTDIRKFSTNRLLSYEAYKKNPDKNIHLILSIMYSPVWRRVTDDHDTHPDDPQRIIDKRARAFMNKKVGDVYGAVFFWAKVWRTLSPVLQTYSNLNSLMIDRHMKEMEAEASILISQNTTAGTPLST